LRRLFELASVEGKALPKVNNEFKAVVFDMDGVVIDSEPNHYRAICEAIGERMTFSYDDFLGRFAGADERYAMEKMAKELGIDYDEDLFQEWSSRKAEAYARFVSESAIPMPGAVDFVESVATEFPIGLATGSRRSDVNAALSVLADGRLEGVFQTIVTSEDVPKPKPHPATYAKAVKNLGFEPSECVAFEDSPNGILSAKGAGLRVIGISAMHGPEKLSQADLVVPDLRGASIDTLNSWFGYE
jgi:beta-phosphoglucomutase